MAIRDLSTYEALLCLSIDQKASAITEDVSELIKVVFACERGTIEDLLKVTAYIVGYSVSINQNTDIKKVKGFAGLQFDKAFDNANSSSIVQSLKGLMESRIFKENEYEFIKGPLLNILKCWIDKAGYTQIFKDLKDNEEIPRMCSRLLQDTYTLNEFWKNDFERKSSFYQFIMEEYIIGFPQFTMDLCSI